MARGAGIALKSLQLFFRLIQFLCAVVILAIFSYFLATLRNHGLDIGTHIRAVEGISGAAVLYTLTGLGALCFVAGIAFFSVTAILLDLAFTGAFIYIAYQNRGGANSCRGNVSTVFGTGSTDTSNSVPAPNGGSTLLPSFRQACQLETACFSVAIVAIVFFLLSAFIEIALMRHHKKESAFGPSPANNYTAGSTGRRGIFGRRHNKRDAALAGGALAAHEKRHPDSLPMHSTPVDVRNSYNTDNTAVGTEPVIGNKKYSNDVPRENYTTPATGYNNTATRNSGYNTTATSNARYDNTAYDNTANTGYTNAPLTGGHHHHHHTNAGYNNTAAYDHTDYQTSGVTGNNEIPARQYMDNSVHNTNTRY